MRRTLRSITGELEFADRPLLLAVLIMLSMGTLVVYGAGSYGRLRIDGVVPQHMSLFKHVAMILVGLAGMLLAMRIDYRLWKRPWVVGVLLGTTVLLTGLTRLFHPIVKDGFNLPQRWIYIGRFGIQPSELAKIAVIMFLAAQLTSLRPGERLTWKRLALILLAGPGALVLALKLQPNYGNILVVGLITASILWVTRAADRVLLWLTAAAPFVAVAGFLFISKIHKRVVQLYSGWTGGSFGDQQEASIIGIAAHGPGGAGLGQGHNKFKFLSDANTDFIFSSLGEEWGMFGGLLMIAAFVLLVWRAYGIAERANDPYGRALATGLATGIAAYGFVNLAMAMGLLPVIGVPLSLVSAGGTTIVATLGAIGVLLNIDRTSRSYEVWRRRWQRGGAA